MKHKTQRIVNRLLFACGILLPSIIIGGTLMLRHTELGQSWLRGQWVEDLSRVTGSDIEIGHIHFIHPGKYALENVSIRDRESGRFICQANQVEVIETDLITQLNIHTLQIPDTTPIIWMNWWNDHVLAIAQQHQLDIKVERTLLDDIRLNTQLNLTAKLELSEAVSKLTINWGEQKHPLALQVIREHQYPSTSTLLLQTNGNPLSLEPLQQTLPMTVDLGKQATFDGQFISKYQTGSFTSDVDFAADGIIHNVELHKILQQDDRAGIDGLATLEIHRAVCSDNQWIRIAGVITGEQGTIARDWLPQLASKLQLRWLGDLRNEEFIPYEALHCEFTWDPKGFTMRGETEGAYIGTILRHKNGPILGDQPDSVIHSASFNEALQR